VFKPKLLLAALVLAAATIPLSNNLNSIALIVFVAACLLQQKWSEARARLAGSFFWIIPVVYFIWISCTYFWDSSGAFTIKELERYTIFLFLPPAFAMIKKLPERHLRYALFSFVLVTIFVSLACLVKAYVQNRVTGDYREFFYQYLAAQMELNAIFLSNFCLASIVWLLYFAFISNKHTANAVRVAVVLVCCFLLGMIFLLSSKLIILLTILIVIIFVLVVGLLRGFFVRSLFVLLLLLAAGYIAVTQIHYLNWRVKTTEFKMYAGPEDDNNGIAIRLFMWQTAIEMIEERPMLGYGLRGARVDLLEQYRKKDFSLGAHANYHSHNQYIESALMAGIPATLLLVSMIAAALIAGIKHRNFLLILIVAHFATQSMFEATFEVQHELVFYIFFIFLFFYHGAGARPKISLNK